MLWYFVSDLHGSIPRYRTLFDRIEKERPEAVLFGGDLLPGGQGLRGGPGRFFTDFLFPELEALRGKLGDAYPRIFAILGNDDPAAEEPKLVQAAERGIIHYMNCTMLSYGDYHIYGYPFIPPSPFMLKDWELYDVSRYLDPGCVSPEKGFSTVKRDISTIRYRTISGDLAKFAEDMNPRQSIFLFHSPPYETPLDRAALDGKSIEHVELDVHVGSIAIRRFIERHQPLLTLHGHIHESVRLSGSWRCRIGETYCFSAAHDGPELAIVIFDPADLESAERLLLE